MVATVKVKVREGWAVYDGKVQRGGGETVEVDPETADGWLAAGWVEKISSMPKKNTSTSTSLTTKAAATSTRAAPLETWRGGGVPKVQPQVGP